MHFEYSTLRPIKDSLQEMTDFAFSVSLCLRGEDYRSFSVVSANSAKTSDAIQKRTIIFDSDHPTNSK